MTCCSPRCATRAGVLALSLIHMVRMSGRGLIAAFAAALCAAGASVASAAENGRIYYPVRADEKTNLLYSANGDGTCATRLTAGEDLVDSSPSTPSDGSPVYFVHTTHVDNHIADAQIYRMDPDGAGRRQITDYAHPPQGAARNPTHTVVDAAVSPNGRRLVLTLVADDYVTAVYAADADGSGLTQLTTPVAAEYDLGPSWAPDGKSVLWVRGDSHGSTIWQMNPDGSGQHAIAATTTGSSYGGMTWGTALFSPDATQILVPKREGGGDPGIAVMNADG